MAISVKKKLLWVLVVTVLLNGAYAGIIILSKFPQSRNVSAGALVEYTCATEDSGVTSLVMSTIPPLASKVSLPDILPNGGKQKTLSFIAPEHTNVNITCAAYRNPDVNQTTALLMIQGLLSGVGNLTSSEVDHCTLHFTWTAPYTLQGVPISYYTINITRHSDGAVLRSDTTNTTEYLYTVSSVGETLEVVVAAVNGAGTGNVSSIVVRKTGNPFFNSKLVKRYRSGTSWTFVLTVIKEEGMISTCGITIVMFQDEHSGVVYKASADFTQLSNGDMSIVANFSNLTENMLYRPSISVYNNGIKLQESNHVDTTQVNANTFDVSRVDYTIHPGVINITVDYVHECESPHQFYVELQCTSISQTLAKFFNGSSGSINNVPSNEQCILLVTDGDAMNSINKTTPFNNTVMTSTIIDDNTSSPTTPSTKPSIEPTTSDQLIIIVIGGSIGCGVAVCIVISVVIVLTIVIRKLHKNKKWCCWDTENIRVSPPHGHNMDQTQTSRSNDPVIEERKPEHEDEALYTEAAFNRNPQQPVDLRADVVYSDIQHQQVNYN